MVNLVELSNMRCEKATPGPKPYRISDRGGLHLLVTPTGGKLWRWKYRFNGKEKQMALGKYPNVPLARARVLHAQARALLASGTDPMAERKETKELKKSECAVKEQNKKFTFEKLARLWFNERWREGKNPHYAADVETRLEHYVIARIGQKSADEVIDDDVIELTKAANERGSYYVAKLNIQMIRNIYRWGKAHRYVPKNMVNPVENIDLAETLKNSKPIKRAHLKINEVPELLSKMREYKGNEITRIAMELLSLTFVRTGELLNARWKEIDWEQHSWRIPEERMKMKRPHVVPLSAQALALLKRLKTISGQGELLFPDANGGLGTMSKFTILFALKRMGYQGRMTGHGWRYIASTYLRSKHYDIFIVELQLSHVEGGVAGIYNEWEAFEERAEMMQAWADALDEMRDQGAGKISLVA